MAFTNSPLVNYTRISPNRDSPRNHDIDRISIHCVVGQCSVQTLGSIFAKTSKAASSNYGVGYDGKIGMYVEEKDRSWCTSSFANDRRAVTIEVASDTTYPYAVRDVAYKAMLDLVEDICRRNGKKKLIWLGGKAKTLAYVPKADEMVMTVHRWFANKSCPGQFLFERHGQIAAEITRRLAGAAKIDKETEECEVTLPKLYRGMQSGYVKTAQILLNKYNKAGLAEDGGFGTKTYEAVVAYQKSRKLDVDGVIGPQTWAQLLC